MNLIQQRMYESILDDIASNKYKIGEKIMTEVAMSRKFNTNRMNAHLAIKVLEQEGILYRNKKQGTLVAAIPSDFELGKLKSMTTRRLCVLNGCPEDFRFIHWNDKIQVPMENVLRKANIQIEYMYTDKLTKPSEYEDLLKQITENGTNAILLIPRDENYILLKNINLALRYQKHIFIYNRGITSWADLPVNSVSIDAFNDGCIVGDYLIRKGYKHIAFCTKGRGDEHFWVRNITRGLEMSVERSNREDVVFQIFHGEAEDIHKRFAKENKKAALIPYSYSNAIEIFNLFTAKGLKLGKDYGILSPNLPNSPDSICKFTAISHSFDLIGKRLGIMISENIDKEGKENFCAKIESEIIENNSC